MTMALTASHNLQMMMDSMEEADKDSSSTMGPVTSFDYSAATSDNDIYTTESSAAASDYTVPTLDTDHNSAIATLLSTKLLQADNEESVASALNEIADLCWQGSEHAHMHTKFVVQHGTLLLVHVMKQFHGSAPIQIAGLRTVQNAASGHSMFVQYNFCRSVVSVGALPVILLAMRNHQNDVLIQAHGCATLLNLVNGNKKRMSKLVVDHKGLETVVEALKTFPECYDLQERGVRLLEAVCRWSEFKPHVIAAGGLVSLANAMVEHLEKEELQAMARRTMSKLCKQSKRTSWPKLLVPFMETIEKKRRGQV